MAPTPAWQPERYEPLLRLKARLLQLDPRFQRRFGDSDLVQETLLRAHQKWDQFQGQSEAELRRWLEEILDHLVKDKVREATAGKRNVYLDESLQACLAESSARIEKFLEADQSSPSGPLERQEQALRLARALDQLAEDQRDVILLRFYLELPMLQIAEQLNRTAKSVAGLYARGLNKLRDLLTNEP
jgi:RNA polymerase sigma-70 factor (ECF subfamily)